MKRIDKIMKEDIFSVSSQTVVLFPGGGKRKDQSPTRAEVSRA